MSKEYRLPRCMIAATGSGSGKTMITCGLLQVLKNRGLVPVSFKCGPDYIDPMFHRMIPGVDCVNLDTFMAGPDGVRDMISRASLTNDKSRVAVMEGVMGIYDGTSPSSLSGSCYEIAKLTNTPIILVADASGIGRTVISLIKGIISDDESGLIRGVIFNRMSDAFYERSYGVIKDELAVTGKDIRILGYIPKTPGMDVSSRHLGLTMPDEVVDIKEKIGIITAVVEDKLDTDALEEIMRSASPVLCPNDEKEHNPAEHKFTSAKAANDAAKPVRMAVARDEAFCFYYSENLRLLHEMGVETVSFSPMADKALPEGVSGLLLGGGYPELYLDELSKNASMLSCIRSSIEDGMPSLAECGGFMYLHAVVEDAAGREYKLASVIDGKCTYTGHLVNFGYVKIEDCDKAEYLKGMRGHEFHYYDSSYKAGDVGLIKPSTGRRYKGMTAGRGRLWGFPHMYYPSAPDALFEFVKEMRRYGG